MEPFRYHVYVCDQRKPEGAPCCSAICHMLNPEDNRELLKKAFATLSAGCGTGQGAARTVHLNLPTKGPLSLRVGFG